jgi:hypothetical protein
VIVVLIERRSMLRRGQSVTDILAPTRQCAAGRLAFRVLLGDITTSTFQDAWSAGD